MHLTHLQFIRRLLHVSCLFFTQAQLQAEVINLPLTEHDNELFIVNMPHAGMSKQQVLDTFGEADSVSQPIGRPAISQWLFTEFTVFFEVDTVLHSLVTPPSPY